MPLFNKKSRSVFPDVALASEEHVGRLLMAAREAAVRIRQVGGPDRDEAGWPKHQHWPPFFKLRRGGHAIVPMEAFRAYSASALPMWGTIPGQYQVFLFVKGSGPWLGEDGKLYSMTGASSGTEFVELSAGLLREIGPKRVDKAILALETLEY